MATDRQHSCAGSRRGGGRCFARLVDSTLATGRSCTGCSAGDGIAGRLSTCTTAAARCGCGRTKMRFGRIALTVVVAVIGLCAPALAQSRRLMGGSAGGSKYQFFYDTFLEPAMPEVTGVGGGTLGGEGVIHRFMSDRRLRVFFGYDILIEVLAEPNTYRINLSPLTLTSEDIRQLFGRDASSWTQLPTADWRG